MKWTIITALTVAVATHASMAGNDTLDKQLIIYIVKKATTITRASKLCPQYEFNIAMFDKTIPAARKLIGDKDVDAAIDDTNDGIGKLIAMGRKDVICDAAKNLDAQFEEYENNTK